MHESTQNGLVTPTLPQHWLTVMLRALVVIVQSVASTLQMNWPRPERDWRTRQTAKVLPKGTNDAQSKETQSVAASDIDCPMALMVSSRRIVRPSNHEGALIARRSEASGSGPLIRVPRKSGDPGSTSPLVPDTGRRRMAEQALSSTPAPRPHPELVEGRGEHGRESLGKSTART